MQQLIDLVPTAPEWRLDWPAIDQSLDCVHALRGCAQDPIHHAEGDVWIHTRMVLEALVASATWRGLAAEQRQITFWGALLHDIGKPARTRVEGDRITSHGHSVLGETMARVLLWRAGVPTIMREQVAALVAHHQEPFFAIDRPNPLRRVARISLRVPCALLACVTEADAVGRRCTDQRRLLDQVELFREYCREFGCLDRPFGFPSEHSRFEYFRRPGRSPDFAARDETRCEVVVMSGLPAVGKDTWIANRCAGWPVVSLDAVREDLCVDASDPQGPVVAQARERARQFLRQATPFVWNATNLTREVRGKCIALMVDYGARIRLVHVEAPEPVLRRRNQARARPVPDAVIDRMLSRWQVPDPTEAHLVEWIEQVGIML
jgi:putative nucleotidyltransferase with HDIG domain